MAINPKYAGDATILDAVKRAARQEQFLEVVSADEARRRFDACIDRSPLPAESVSLGAVLGRVLQVTNDRLMPEATSRAFQRRTAWRIPQPGAASR